MNKKNIIEAINIIIQTLQNNEIENKNELRAVVSHYLQNMSKSLPFLTRKLREQIESVLYETQNTTHREKDVINEAGLLYQTKLDFMFETLPYAPPKNYDFTFIDLFAGIGGFRIAFQSNGGKCVFSSEWDKFAKLTYEANFGETPYGDIRKIRKSEIPNHDVLCAGFPCQPFSLAGVSKKNSLGMKHGFDDETQGTLFFDIKEIIELKRPKVFMLENVKNLLSHDHGRTFNIIKTTLESLNYTFNWKIVDGVNWVPQHRERIFIVGFDNTQFKLLKNDIIIPDRPESSYKYPYLKSIIKEKLEGYTLGPGTWETLKRHKAHHESRGNGFGYRMHTLPITENDITRTISARYHKDGAEILVEQKDERPRRLSVEEAMQLQGYNPSKFIFPVSKTQAYRQIGNSVVVPAIAATAKEICKILRSRV